MFRFILFCGALLVVGLVKGQAIEGVVLERFYVSDGNDAKRSDLTEGSITYRVYVDLAEGYSLQAVYGQKGHPLTISTTTQFFNSEVGGSTGADLKRSQMTHNTQLLDSYITVGAATMDRIGVPMSLDQDGSTVVPKKKNGLANSKNEFSFSKQDGLMEGKLPALTNFGSDFSAFETGSKANSYTTENGAWAVFGGFVGCTEENMVLIAQLTTDGELSFEFNLQIGHPDGSSVRYVAKDPKGEEQLVKELNYPL